MYAFLVCFALFLTSVRSIEQDVVVVAPELINKVQPHVDKCITETKAPSDSFTKMLAGNIDTAAGIEFIYCFLTRTGYVEKDGHYNVEKFTTLLKEDYPKREEYKKVFEDCNKTSGKDNLETINLMAKCYKENSPVIFVAN